MCKLRTQHSQSPWQHLSVHPLCSLPQHQCCQGDGRHIESCNTGSNVKATITGISGVPGTPVLEELNSSRFAQGCIKNDSFFIHPWFADKLSRPSSCTRVRARRCSRKRRRRLLVKQAPHVIGIMPIINKHSIRKTSVAWRRRCCVCIKVGSEQHEQGSSVRGRAATRALAVESDPRFPSVELDAVCVRPPRAGRHLRLALLFEIPATHQRNKTSHVFTGATLCSGEQTTTMAAPAAAHTTQTHVTPKNNDTHSLFSSGSARSNVRRTKFSSSPCSPLMPGGLFAKSKVPNVCCRKSCRLGVATRWIEIADERNRIKKAPYEKPNQRRRLLRLARKQTDGQGADSSRTHTCNT